MSAPSPSMPFVTARRVLREEAVSRTERSLRVSPDLMPVLAGVAAEQLVPALSELDPRHAGWAMIAAGTLLMRNCERLGTAGGELAPDPSFTGALAWSGLLCAVLGDRRLDAELRPLRRPWQPSEPARDLRRRAGEVVGAAEDPRELAGRRFAAYARTELESGLGGLDAGQAGFALIATGAWIAGNEARIAEPLCERRGLARRVVKDAERAIAGCGLAASLLVQIGVPLADSLAPV